MLHLDFDTALPLYKVITIDDQTRVAEEDMDLRYIVSVYPITMEISISRFHKHQPILLIKRFVQQGLFNILVGQPLFF